jgi:hypothetical protein
MGDKPIKIEHQEDDADAGKQPPRKHRRRPRRKPGKSKAPLNKQQMNAFMQGKLTIGRIGPNGQMFASDTYYLGTQQKIL